MTVVVAGKFNDQLAPGGPARQADRGHGGFGAGGNKTYPLHKRHAFAHLLGQQGFALGGGAKG